MSTTERKSDEVLDRLVLDIKAFVLLQDSERSLRAKVQERLVDSHDEQVKQFVDSMRTGRRSGVGQLVIVGIGELVLASILVLAGTVTLIPTMLGFSTPQDLISYFSSQILSPLANSPVSQYASAIEFLVGAFLLLAAFYTLRQAAVSFKGVGLSVKPSDE